MEKIYSSMTEMIGSTPLVELGRLAGKLGLKARLVVKAERQNPGGSAKDRPALEMIRQAERDGRLAPGGMIIEPTSGNTGIGLAACAAVLGYRAVIVMPDSMSIERRKLIAAYGAEIVLTPGAEGMSGAIRRAEELHRENPGSIIAGQFDNPANAMAHYLTTGPEIWNDTDGNVDIFVSAVGTGGTISGTGKYLKEQKSAVTVVAVEPEKSPVLSGGKAGAHGIQGIGAGFIPGALDTSVYDRVMVVSDEEAFEFMRLLAKTEGLLVGISSGAALCAAVKLAAMAENEGKMIVALLPDSGERYMSVM